MFDEDGFPNRRTCHHILATESMRMLAPALLAVKSGYVRSDNNERVTFSMFNPESMILQPCVSL